MRYSTRSRSTTPNLTPRHSKNQVSPANAPTARSAPGVRARPSLDSGTPDIYSCWRGEFNPKYTPAQERRAGCRMGVSPGHVRLDDGKAGLVCGRAVHSAALIEATVQLTGPHIGLHPISDATGTCEA